VHLSRLPVVDLIYSYDKASNRTGFTDPESGSTSYAYDTLNRLQTLTPPTAFTSGNFGFSYDGLSRRTQMTRPNSVTTNYAYDNLSHLTSVLHQLSGSTIDGAAYTLDNAGNRTAKTDERAGVTSNYSYDAIYELTQVTQGTSTTESYSFDPVGNRTASLGVASYTTNSSNELTGNSNASYTYDYNGNTLTKVVGSNTTTYAWDFENRLTSVTLPGSGGTISFAYDPFGRRIKKVTPSATSIFAYDGDNLIEETNSSGTAVARYSQGLNIDEPLAMLRSSATSFYQADGLGSITSLSNGTGSLAQTYTFDSFGNLTNSSGSLTNPFQYTGREFDPETGLYYYRARYYDQTFGRFISEDPIGFGSAQNDFYDYVSNSPLGAFDPSGLAFCTYDISEGWLSCIPQKPGDPYLLIPVSSGNDGDSQHHCKDNPNCPTANGGHGPIPPGWYQWGGPSATHTNSGGMHLFPIPRTGTPDFTKDGRFLTHSCKNPFANPFVGPFCSTGCVTSTPDNIKALNQLLNAEPGSVLNVVAGPPDF